MKNGRQATKQEQYRALSKGLFILIILFLAGCKGKESIIYDGKSQVLWETPYNTGGDYTPQYIDSCGEWGRPLGLYSFAVGTDKIFLEDSVKHQVLALCEEDNPFAIVMPEEVVCTQMIYNEEEEILYMICFDNVAVEPEGKTYWKVDLNAGTNMDFIKAVSYDASLDCDGNLIENPPIISEELKKEMKSIIEKKGLDAKGKISFETCKGEWELYSYITNIGGDIMLFLCRNNQIEAFTDILAGGDFVAPGNQLATIYADDDKTIVCYLTQGSSESIQVVRPTFEEYIVE